MKKAQSFCVIFFLLVAFLIAFASTAQACTTFCLRHNGELIFGRNYDFPIGYGLVMINKRNVTKTAMAEASDRAAQWTAQYGSVTFNQFGRDMPMGGMNEAGLIVELMQLDDTQYPAPDSRPAVGCLEWIQYQLDICANVQEVIQQAEKVRIRAHVGIHYLLADSKGQTASIEFLHGKLVVHRGEKMPVEALANSTYQESLAYSKRFASNNAFPSSSSSLDRFTRAGAMVKNYQPKAAQSPIDYAFEILRNVAQGSHTQWSIVYDVRNLALHFITREATQRRSLALESFDFDCAAPIKILDMNAEHSGEVATKFVDYTRAANRKLVFDSFQNSPFTRHIPESALEEIAKHAETSACQNF